MGKRCSSCDTPKALDEFPPDKRCKDGRGAKCRTCASAVQAAYYTKYPEKEAARRIKNAEHGQAWYQQNREAIAEKNRWNMTRRKYGVDRERYYKMLAEQGGRCKICKTTNPGRKDGYFSIEHDHTSGQVRGLTCHPCNVGVGMFKDNPMLLRAAAAYLEEATSGRDD